MKEKLVAHIEIEKLPRKDLHVRRPGRKKPKQERARIPTYAHNSNGQSEGGGGGGFMWFFVLLFLF